MPPLPIQLPRFPHDLVRFARYGCDSDFIVVKVPVCMYIHIYIYIYIYIYIMHNAYIQRFKANAGCDISLGGNTLHHVLFCEVVAGIIKPCVNLDGCEPEQKKAVNIAPQNKHLLNYT